MSDRSPLSKDFTLVAAGQIISLFGNQILRYALPLHLLNQTGSAALFGTVSALSFIPMILLFPIGGIIADRVNKRNIMVILDFTTALIISLFYLLLRKIDILPLMTATMITLYGIQGAYQPAVKASIPSLVEQPHMMRANALIDLVSSLAGMTGPIIGGILYSIVGLTPILYTSAACFLASALMETFIHIPHQKRPSPDNILVTALKDLKQSFHFMFKEKPVLWKISLVYASTNLLLTSLVLIAIPVLITQHMGFNPNTANKLYGYAQGTMATGSILGGILAGTLSKKLKLNTSPLILTGCALSILLSGIALQTLKNPIQTYIALTAACSLLLTLSTLLQIQIMTYIQILTPNALTGKVTACVICLCMCTNPIGQFAYGIIYENIQNHTYLPFYAAALIMTLITLLTRHIFHKTDHFTENKTKLREPTKQEAL